MAEVRNVYRPIRINPIYIDKGVYEFINTYDFTELSQKLECKYQVTQKGNIIISNKIDISLPAKSKKVVTIPELAGLSGETGSGSNSCGPYLKEKYQLNSKNFDFDFLISPTINV